MPPLVAIVVLNWNGAEDTLRCLESLERQTYPNFRLLVVDNGSTDGSLAALRALGERITLIESPENLGYTGGNNLGMRRALADGADYLWLFNNDATAAPDTLARLIATCEADPAIGLASPLVCDDQDHATIHFAGGRFDLAAPTYEPTEDLEKARLWQAAAPGHMALWGTAMLARRALVEKIGLLDDRIFAYWEDIDYSIRSALAGFRNVMVFDAVIFHAAKPTIRSPRDVKPYYFYFMTRNEILMWRKFCPTKKYLRALLWTILRQARQIDRMRDSQAHVDAVRAGLWDGLRGKGGAYQAPNGMARLSGGAIVAAAKRFFPAAQA